MTNSFRGKKVVITGGTGSFGSTMLRNLLDKDVEQVRVFSRDELKQDNLRRELSDERIQFVLGDTRERDSMRHLFSNVDYVFHAAALKQVPSGEFFPMQVVNTNILGSNNVLNACIEAAVEAVVVLSTDKAVYPINAMGMSKALMEKSAIAEARRIGNSGTRISVTRYGNVMMSRGSVIPAFLKLAKEGKSLSITNPQMTRFMMSLGESVDLVEHALINGLNGSTYVRKAPGASLETLAEAIGIVLEAEIRTGITGSRHGEKMHESLLSLEESSVAIDDGDYYSVPMDDRSLDYGLYFDPGQSKLGQQASAYTSENTNQLTSVELAKLISGLAEYREHFGVER